jgi:hypothetical protein
MSFRCAGEDVVGLAAADHVVAGGADEELCAAEVALPMSQAWATAEISFHGHWTPSHDRWSAPRLGAQKRLHCVISKGFDRYVSSFYEKSTAVVRTRSSSC